VLVDSITILLNSKVPQAGFIVKEMRNMYSKSYFWALNYMDAIKFKKTPTFTTDTNINEQFKKEK
jgi:hypothetical protein